ncbi:MAG: SRPBCC family protein [Longimicrobiales bacterium]|nr:SRPBCC family protein [Longimicrobiales bacterium]
MSSLSIEERFTLDAPPSAVWRFLTDPERVVRCLPGAELTGQQDESTYEGSLKVSAGPVTVAYRGTAVFEEVDDEKRYVRIVGRGRERSGSGNASMTMESRVEEAEGGGTAVSVTADVRVTGKIVRFGRGMIESVSAEMFSDFTKRLEERVRDEEGVASPETDQEAEVTSDSGRRGRAGADGPPEAGPASDDGAARERASRGSGGPEAETRGDGEESADDTLALLPLLWRSFKRWLGGLFG